MDLGPSDALSEPVEDDNRIIYSNTTAGPKNEMLNHFNSCDAFSFSGCRSFQTDLGRQHMRDWFAILCLLGGKEATVGGSIRLSNGTKPYVV